MSFFATLFGKKGAKPRKSGSERRHESALYISASDGGWNAALADGTTIRWQKRGWSAVPVGEAVPAYHLAEAVSRLEAEQPQANVTSVVLTVDDPDMHIVDHRFAKLTNFEPRALKEFGAQQAGGRQVAFSSLAFGASAAREIERRVLSFLPEDRLQNLFFPLGKMAPSLVAVVPGATRALFAEQGNGIFASLRVHGYFSTLTIANAENGLIAVRQLPLGALTLAQAYGNAHGLSLQESIAALNARVRLPVTAAVKGEPAPEYRTATLAALGPPLRGLVEEIAASIEYFRFERLAGRPVHLSLVFTGPGIAGLEAWLAEALELQVETVEETAAAAAGSQAPVLNLLEQSRAGLLKMGNQPYEFARGRFVAMKVKGAQSQMTAKPKSKLAGQLSTQLTAQFPALAKFVAIGGSDLSISREMLMLGGGIAGALAALAVFNFGFLMAPAQRQMAEGVANYTSLATAAVTTASALAGKTEAPNRGQVNLWAADLLSVGKAMVPGMKLQKLQLGAGGGGGGKAGETDLKLLISGALPSGSAANLKLVAVFIDRLSKDEAFARRFGQINFAGAGESTDLTKHEMLFNVAAAPAGAKK